MAHEINLHDRIVASMKMSGARITKLAELRLRYDAHKKLIEWRQQPSAPERAPPSITPGGLDA